MPRNNRINNVETITDPLIELLAIKLFEHDVDDAENPGAVNAGWMMLANEDRESYRKMARGEEPIGPEEE
jgi:hypothetical protein